LGIVSTKLERRKAMRRAARRILVVLGLGVLVVSSLYMYDYATTSTRFAIHRVEFSGLARINESAVNRVLSDLPGQNILLAPLDTYEARIESFPRVAHASLRRVFPDRIVVAIEERTPVALVWAGRLLEVDASGMVMPDDAYTPLLKLPVIRGVASGEVRPGEVSDSPGLLRALRALGACKRYGGRFVDDIAELQVDRAGIQIRSLARNVVIILGERDYGEQIRKYFSMSKNIAVTGKTHFIDLRFDDQIVLRGGV